jgi:exodeoxyribonuclease (lambda-induced)
MVAESRGARKDISHLPPIAYGVENEPKAIAQLEFMHDITVIQTGFYAFNEVLGASPDGLVGDDAVVEVKCPYSLRSGGEFKSVFEQPHYMHQVQLEMLATGRDRAYFYQWSPVADMLEIVERDTEWLKYHTPMIDSFMADLHAALKGNPKELELAALLDEQDEIKDKINALRDDIYAECGGDFIGSLITITSESRRGAVDYKKALDSVGADIDLEQYRRKPTTSLTMRRIKQ